VEYIASVVPSDLASIHLYFHSPPLPFTPPSITPPLTFAPPSIYQHLHLPITHPHSFASASLRLNVPSPPHLMVTNLGLAPHPFVIDIYTPTPIYIRTHYLTHHWCLQLSIYLQLLTYEDTSFVSVHSTR